MTRKRAVAGAAVLLAYTLLAVLWYRTAWADPANRLVGGCCDAPTYAWYLRWVPYALGNGDGGLLTTHLNAPEGVNLMWQASLPLLGVLGAPVTLLFGPFVAYNLFSTLAVSLSAFTCFLALRRWVGGYAGPVAGGLLFGFSPYMAAHSLGHLNFTFVALVPLIFLALDDLLVRQARRWWVGGGVLGLLATAQLLVSEEVLASSALLCAVVVVILAVAYPAEVRARAAYAAKAVGATAAVTAVLSAYPLWVQFRGPQHLGGEPIRKPNVFVTDLSNYWTPTKLTALNDASGCFRCAEVGGYVGIPLLLLCVAVAVVAWRRPVVRVAALGAFAAAVLSLGGSVHLNGEDVAVPLPGRVLDAVPVLKNLLPIRFPLYVFLGAAVLLAEGVRRMASRPRLAPLGAVALGLVVVTLWPVAPFPSYRYEVPEFFRTSAVERLPEGRTVLVLPFPGANPGTVETMLWQAEADMRYRMPGGYYLAPVDGRTTTGGRTTFLRRVVADLGAGRPVDLTEDLRTKVLADLDRYGVEHVLLGPARHRDALRAFVPRLVGTDPDESGGVLVWPYVSAGR